MTWRNNAACVGHVDVFFPEQAQHLRTQQLRTARTICKTCPVIDDCREYVLTHDEPHGIWAGMTLTQIRLLRTEHGITPKTFTTK